MRYFNCFLLLVLLQGSTLFGQNARIPERAGDCFFSSQNSFLNNISVKIDTNGWIEFMPIGLFEPGDLFKNHKSELGMSANDEMVLVKSNIGKNGDEHFRYDQYYKGIPVECGKLIEHFKNCLLVTLNGKFLCDISIDTTGKISPNSAINIALADMNAMSYMWQDTTAERELREDSGNPNETYYPKPQLIIDCAKNLVYKLKVNTTDTIIEYRINAKTGAIIDKIDPVLKCGHISSEHDESSKHICSSKLPNKKEVKLNPVLLTDFVTFGPTLFSGIQPIRTTWSSSKHRLIANNYSSKIETRDNQGKNENAWDRKVTMNGVGSTTWPVAETRHTQTHWAVQKSWDYFSGVHGKSVGAGNGTIKVKSNCGIMNAFYLGDGRSLAFGFFGTDYLGKLDVAGHEFTHLLIDESNGLGRTGNPESRSLNESFADIFGTSIEREFRPGGWDWMLNGEGTTLRNVLNPNLSPIVPGIPSGPQPITYLTDPRWNAPGQPHLNGGVQNRWFSLLALGGTQNGITVQGIGIDKAASITLHNIDNYIETSSRYIDSRNGAVNSARDIFGNCSFEHAQTQLAWQAVGVGTATNCFTQTGSTTICVDKKNLPNSVTISNSFGQNLTWTPLTLTIFGTTRTTVNWTFTTSGIKNNILTITNIPNNLALGGFYFFMYTDQAGNRGFVHFIVQECPGIAPPNPPSIDYCSSFISSLLNIRSREENIQQNQLEKLVIKPNPVVDNLSLGNAVIGDEFKIIDLSGKIMKFGIIDNSEISVSDINEGMYLIYTSNINDKIIRYGKFVKEN
jgi:Zn-dependent metalloprotease